jgi:biopolymer transport protein ExbD
MDSFPEENVGARIAKTLSDNPDAVFVIRGDRRASYEAVVSVLDELKKSGARHVSIATDPKKGT